MIFDNFVHKFFTKIRHEVPPYIGVLPPNYEADCKRNCITDKYYIPKNLKWYTITNQQDNARQKMKYL